MKRLLVLLLMFAPAAWAAPITPTPSPNLWVCYNSSAGYIPVNAIAAGNAVLPIPAPRLAVGENTNGSYYALSCDSSGNLIISQSGHIITAPLVCADTSGSGTVQVCNTSPTFTPAANDCIIYTTTSANSGTGLTLNVNSLGAKSVAKWLGSTTLAAGDVAAGEGQLACYNGTVWNLSTIGNAPGGIGGSVTVGTIPIGVTNTHTLGDSPFSLSGGTIISTDIFNVAPSSGNAELDTTLTSASAVSQLVNTDDEGNTMQIGIAGSSATSPLSSNSSSFILSLEKPLDIGTNYVPCSGYQYQGVNFYVDGDQTAWIDCASGQFNFENQTNTYGIDETLNINLDGTTVTLSLDGSTGNDNQAVLSQGNNTPIWGDVALSLPAGVPTYTKGTSTTSCAAASGYTNSNTHGEITIVGGTATTGTICTINWSTTIGAPGWCTLSQNGGATLFGIGHGVPGTTSMTITAGISVATSTVNIDYLCGY